MPPPPWRKIALGAVVVLALAAGAAALIVPEIEEGKEERAAEERRRDAAYEAAKQRELARESRPRCGRGRAAAAATCPRPPSAGARRHSCEAVERAITRDARARVRAGKLDGPILATECEINPHRSARSSAT